MDDAAWNEEHRNVTNLIRVLGGLAAWMTLSAGGAMALWDFDEHVAHIALLLPVGVAFVAVVVFAPRLAVRFVD